MEELHLLLLDALHLLLELLQLLQLISVSVLFYFFFLFRTDTFEFECFRTSFLVVFFLELSKLVFFIVNFAFQLIKLLSNWADVIIQGIDGGLAFRLSVSEHI